MREREAESRRGEPEREGGKKQDGWGVRAVDGFLICACVRVERGRQEENKTQKGRERETRETREIWCRPPNTTRRGREDKLT